MGKSERRFERLESAVHRVLGDEGQRKVPEPDGKLTFGHRFVRFLDCCQIECRRQPASIGALFAMNQDGFLGAFHENDQSIGLRSRQFAPRGHSEVDMGNAQSTRFANLRVVPGASGIIATQINDRLDTVLLGVLGDLRRRQLPDR
jgi:hypothetical protein